MTEGGNLLRPHHDALTGDPLRGVPRCWGPQSGHNPPSCSHNRTSNPDEIPLFRAIVHWRRVSSALFRCFTTWPRPAGSDVLLIAFRADLWGLVWHARDGFQTR